MSEIDDLKSKADELIEEVEQHWRQGTFERDEQSEKLQTFVYELIDRIAQLEKIK